MKRTGLAVFGYTALTLALLVLFSSSAQAIPTNLIDDGDFESLNSNEDWDIREPVKFEKLPDGDSRIANVGERGTGRNSRLSQSFLLPVGVSMVSISFDYLFTGFALGSSDFPDESADVFNATFGYNLDPEALTDDTILGNLVSATSAESDFDTRMTFSPRDFQVDSALGIPFIAFDLTESVSDFDFGTRVEIDNVVVSVDVDELVYEPVPGPVPETVPEPVPEPATILMLAAGIAGLAGFKRKIASKGKTF